MQSQRGMITLLVGLICVLTIILSTQKSPNAAHARPAPDATLLLDPKSPPVQISSFKGKVLILDLWATWCGPCRQSMPELEKLYQKYHSKGLEVIGVSEDAKVTQPQIPAVKQALGVTYPTPIGEATPDVLKAYSSGSLPTLYVIDKEGNIRSEEQGFDPMAKLTKVDKLVQDLLNE